MDFSIREAKPEDYHALLQLFDGVDACHRQALPHIFRVPNGPSRARSYIYGIIQDEDAALFVAETDGQLIGQIHVAIRETPEIPILVPRRYGFVDTLAVMGPYRRAGIGRALMERAQQWTLDRGLAEIELSVWEFNAGAIAFYEDLGYRSTRRVMGRSLAPSAADRG
jgi:ribosomal protein S18 acetylase RimI-like enzyme